MIYPDGLSKSVITGLIIAPSEQYDVFIQGAKKFGLDKV
jgi:hypothetical protein